MDNNEFDLLAKKFYAMAKRKLGFPTSFLSLNQLYINNEPLGIKPDSLANILINEVGDPHIESNTWKIEVKNYEKKIIDILAKYFGLEVNDAKGYVTTGGTEGNEACLRWSKKFLINKKEDKLFEAIRIKTSCINKIKFFERKLKNNLYCINNKVRFLKKINYYNKLLKKQLKIISQIKNPSLFFTQDYTHYSILKIADALNLNTIKVKNLSNGKMDLNYLKKIIDLHKKKFPFNPIIINANIGSTLNGCIDDVNAMRKVLDDSYSRDDYLIHMDGAMLGLLMPVLQPFGKIESYFELGDTLSLSFHKYLGVPQPCGLALTSKKIIDCSYKNINKCIEYAGNIMDITVSGSRSGLNILLVYNALVNGLELDKNNKKINNLINSDLEIANYFYKKLVEILGEENVFYIPGQFNIVIPRPNEYIVNKYQLMVNDHKAIICVFNNVNKNLVNDFIQDLTK